MSIESGAWFGPKHQCSEEIKTECYGDYNEALMEPLTPTIGFILRIIQVPTAIMCILCYKWRFLADYLYHVETAIRLLAMLHLNYSNYLLDFRGLLGR